MTTRRGLVRRAYHTGHAAVVAGLMLAAAGGCEPARPQLPHEAKLGLVQTVAVLTFVDAPGSLAKGSGKIVVNAAIAELYQCQGVSVVEAARLNAIMNELDLQRTDMVDDATASKIGKLAGADLVILGEITQYEAQKEYSHGAVHMFSAGGTKTIHQVGLSLRGVSVKDGQVIYAELGHGTSEKGYSPALKLAAKGAIRPLALFFRERPVAEVLLTKCSAEESWERVRKLRGRGPKRGTRKDFVALEELKRKADRRFKNKNYQKAMQLYAELETRCRQVETKMAAKLPATSTKPASSQPSGSVKSNGSTDRSKQPDQR